MHSPDFDKVHEGHDECEDCENFKYNPSHDNSMGQGFKSHTQADHPHFPHFRWNHGLEKDRHVWVEEI